MKGDIVLDYTKWNYTYYKGTGDYVWVTILYRGGSEFYTVSVVVKKPHWQIELISHEPETLEDAKALAYKMHDACLQFNIPTWKEY